MVRASDVAAGGPPLGGRGWTIATLANTANTRAHRPLETIDTTATVETPERVRFRYRIAGPGQRAAAWVLDTILQLLLGTVFAITALLLSTASALEGVGQGVMLLAFFAIQWLYGVVFETLTGGRTPGKLALELRVVRTDGAPGRFQDFLLRNLVRAADFLPVGFGLGVLVMLLDPRMRRLGDLVAGTVVVAENRSAVLDPVRIDPPVTEDERQALPARVDLHPGEVEVIEAFLRRRRRLNEQRAQELAAQFAPVLAERTGIEAASHERILTLAYARATGRDRPAGGT